jgi:hypothetical protein
MMSMIVCAPAMLRHPTPAKPDDGVLRPALRALISVQDRAYSRHGSAINVSALRAEALPSQSTLVFAKALLPLHRA